MEAYHGSNWTEWNVVTNAQPRYAGHQQPNLPLTAPGFGLDADETDPAVMEQKVIAARAHGIDAFLFDWYWYAEKGPAGGAGGTFLANPLEQGFLNMPSDHGMKFAVMWANQDWVDIHPAKKGWHATGRPVSADFKVSTPPGGTKMLMIFDGLMNAKVYMGGFQHAITTYFKRPNYYRAPTRLPNGTVAQCPYFSIYQANYLVAGIGGAAAASSFMALVRQSALDAGTCIHIALMTAGGPGDSDSVIDVLQPDSMDTYCIMKVTTLPTFPESDYLTVTDSGIQAWAALRDHFKTKDLAFAPSASVAWDSSPRTLVMDPYTNDAGYPWGPAIHSNAKSLALGMQKVKSYMDQVCANTSATLPGAAWCPPLLINAWNEWSEGAYLEPDRQNGWMRLQVLNSTFHGL